MAKPMKQRKQAVAPKLNAAQNRAVQTLSGPLMVLAGAGTGKTRVITYRIANLIGQGVSPGKILAVTFTNKAAKEMRARVRTLVNSKSDEMPVVSTFHSFCVQVLRKQIGRMGFPNQFTICDRSDQEDVARIALREERVDPKYLDHRGLLAFISRWKMQGLRSEAVFETVSSEQEGVAAKAYEKYEKALKSSGCLDFDDLLLTTEELFNDHAEALEEIQNRFSHVLVDEYQDTNSSQFRIVKQVSQRSRNLCVVGDDDQSIYAWRGADIRNLLDFPKHFPDAIVVRLEDNYRCCPNILELANRVIQFNKERHPKELKATLGTFDRPRFLKFANEVEEAQAVCRDIIAARAADGLAFGDFAVLFRTNEQPRLFETEFRSNKIPYSLVGGYSFFDRREIRDLIAFLKVIARPQDETALRRVLNVSVQGVGPTAIDKLMTRAIQNGYSLWDSVQHTVEHGDLAGNVTLALRDFSQVVHSAQKSVGEAGLSAMAKQLIESIRYRSVIDRQYKDPQDRKARWESVGELLNMLTQHEESNDNDSTLPSFLEKVTLEGREKSDDDSKQKNAVTLMTLHAAKGLEFPHVYLVGMEEGLLPHGNAASTPEGVDEERRLVYVGITRAKRRLTLSRAETRPRFGKRAQTIPSRFLPEMFGKVAPGQDSFQYVATTVPKPESRRRSASRGFQKHRFRK